MNKSFIIKQIANTKFSELPEETLEEIYLIIEKQKFKVPEELDETECNSMLYTTNRFGE